MVRRTPVTVAVLGFFVLAGVGWFSGVAPFLCGIRALIGAAVLYVLARIAGRVLVHIMADAMLRGSAGGKGSTNESGERRR